MGKIRVASSLSKLMCMCVLKRFKVKNGGKKLSYVKVRFKHKLSIWGDV